MSSGHSWPISKLKTARKQGKTVFFFGFSIKFEKIISKRLVKPWVKVFKKFFECFSRLEKTLTIFLAVYWPFHKKNDIIKIMLNHAFNSILFQREGHQLFGILYAMCIFFLKSFRQKSFQVLLLYLHVHAQNSKDFCYTNS